jgi:hypothetical protein
MGFSVRSLSVVAIIFVVLGVVEVSADDRSTMCTRLQAGLKNYNEGTDGYESLSAEHARNCTPQGNFDDDTAYWKTKYPGEVENHYLNARPSRIATTDEVGEKVREALAKSQADQYGMFDDCKAVCASSEVNCRGTIANANSVGDGDYARVSGLFNGNEASVNQGCNSISNYQATAESQMNLARTSCGTYKKQCDQVCENARTKSASSAYAANSTWMLMNENAGQAFSQGIITAMNNGQSQISSKVQSLNEQCTSAKQQLAEARIDRDKARRDAAEQRQTQNQLGNALQSLGSQLAGQDNSQMPYDPGFGQQPYAPPVDNPTQYTAPGVMGAVKGEADFKSSGRYDDAGLLDAGLGGLPARERKPHGQPQQQGGGGSAGVGAGGGGGQANGANAKARAGRSRLDADVYKGSMSGGGPATGGRGGDGYPDEGQRGEGRGRAAGSAVAAGNVRMVDLQKFLPQRLAVRRGVANTTGPDGITGPHTDLFKKVRSRYLETVLDY